MNRKPHRTTPVQEYRMQLQVVTGSGEWRNFSFARTVSATHACTAARKELKARNARPGHHRVLVCVQGLDLPLIFHPDDEE